MPKSDNLYISLYHGRNSPDEQLDEWGFNGPLIGPVGVSWTYDTVKLHAPGWDTFEHLPTEGGCLRYGGKFYGDFEVITHDDRIVTERHPNRPLHDYVTFVRNIQPTT